VGLRALRVVLVVGLTVASLIVRCAVAVSGVMTVAPSDDAPSRSHSAARLFLGLLVLEPVGYFIFAANDSNVPDRRLAPMSSDPPSRL